jgi:hypothetical protein
MVGIDVAMIVPSIAVMNIVAIVAARIQWRFAVSTGVAWGVGCGWATGGAVVAEIGSGNAGSRARGDDIAN